MLTKTDKIDVRFEGVCDCCGAHDLYSYTIRNHKYYHPDHDRQYCGYYCNTCGFTAPGDREGNKKDEK